MSKNPILYKSGKTQAVIDLYNGKELSKENIETLCKQYNIGLKEFNILYKRNLRRVKS